MGIPPAWVGLVDDAAIFPPGNAPLHDAAADHVARRGEWWADLVGPLVVKDTDVPLLRGSPARLSVVVTGGAGQVAGPAGLCRKLGLELAGLEIALRDLDDLPGNARRVVAAVDAARADEALGEDVPVYVELPQTEPSAGWLAAADELAAAELRLKFRTGGVEAHLFPTAPTVAAWIDAALDRETPFKCTAGLHDALRHRDPETGFEHHGFLNVLTATAPRLRRRHPRRGGRDPRRAGRRPAARAGATDRASTRAGAGSRRSDPARSPTRSSRSWRPDSWRTREHLTFSSWVDGAAGSGYDADHLPYGVFAVADEDPRVGVRIGDHVLDLTPVAASDMLDTHHLFDEPSLNELLAAGRPVWESTRAWITGLVTDETERDLVEPHLVPLDEVTMLMPFQVGDYVDFYASLDHATNVGRLFRPDAEPLLPNWRWLPVGYHGRGGTVVPSGTDIVRPQGQRKAPDEREPSYGPSRRLDIEAELGFVVGRRLGAG